MKSRAFSLVEIIVVLAVLAAVGSSAIVHLANTRQSAESAKLASDVDTLNRAIPLYATFGGSFAEEDTIDEVLHKLKTRRTSTNANTSPGLTENFLDPRVMPEMQNSAEAGSSQERATLIWDKSRHIPRFEIVSNGDPGIKRFVLDETQTVSFAGAAGDDLGHREIRSDFLLASDRTSKTGKWVWEYENSGTDVRAPVFNPELGAPSGDSGPFGPDNVPPDPTPMPTPPKEEGESLPKGALVGSMSTLDGTFNGNIVMAYPASGSLSNMTINGGARLKGSLYLPGTPTIINGNGRTYTEVGDAGFANYVLGVVDGEPVTPRIVDLGGKYDPTNYQVKVDGKIEGKIYRQIERCSLPVVNPPPAPTGLVNTGIVSSGTHVYSANVTKDVTLQNSPGADVTLNPGSYGAVRVQTGKLTLVGSNDPDNPAVYSFQSLAKAGAILTVSGYVTLTVGSLGTIDGVLGNSTNEGYLTLRVSGSGSITQNGGSAIYAQLVAPNAAVQFNQTFVGSIVAKSLSVNGSGIVFSLPPKID